MKQYPSLNVSFLRCLIIEAGNSRLIVEQNKFHTDNRRETILTAYVWIKQRNGRITPVLSNTFIWQQISEGCS